MTTYSQMVDGLLAETRRADMRNDICTYINQTIRELHHEKNSGQAIGFHSNLVELEITATDDEGFGWNIVNAHLYQKQEAVYYDSIGKYARQKYPSSAYAGINEVNADVYFYRSGNRLIFSGYGGEDSVIKLAWFAYPRRLTYYMPTANTRPAVWDDETQSFTYSSAYVTVDEKATAVELVTNWLIQRHTDLIEQGARAKIWTRLGDKDRAGPAYSQFESLKPSFVAAETHESISSYVS